VYCPNTRTWRPCVQTGESHRLSPTFLGAGTGDPVVGGGPERASWEERPSLEAANPSVRVRDVARAG
jgi:hypothetical protein